MDAFVCQRLEIKSHFRHKLVFAIFAYRSVGNKVFEPHDMLKTMEKVYIGESWELKVEAKAQTKG